MSRYYLFVLGILILSIYVLPFSEFHSNINPATNRSEPTYHIAFANFGPLNDDIFIADADGAHARPLLANPANDYNASFSRDGKWIVFTSERNGSADIYRAHPDGSGLEQLTNDPSFDDQAAFSPDGEKIAFVSSRNKQADIFILDIATKKIMNITNHPAGDFRPSWSPDGEWIAFSTDRDAQRIMPVFTLWHSTEIYTIRVDGSALKRRTKIHMRAAPAGRLMESKSSFMKQLCNRCAI